VFEPYYTSDQAADAAGVHRQTLTNALRDGSLHGVQRVKRGNWRIAESCLMAWIEGRPCAHAEITKEAA
jgi:excisionase family DNA binding protein